MKGQITMIKNIKNESLRPDIELMVQLLNKDKIFPNHRSLAVLKQCKTKEEVLEFCNQLRLQAYISKKIGAFNESRIKLPQKFRTDVKLCRTKEEIDLHFVKVYANAQVKIMSELGRPLNDEQIVCLHECNTEGDVNRMLHNLKYN
jgi:hypothetical protein